MPELTNILTKKSTKKEKNSWYEEWFDSDYYHILYRERDEEEAKLFLNNLLHKLLVTPNQKILDLACGRGRHANYLAAINYDVTGLDLSPASIDYAIKQAPPNASFDMHDMREPFGTAIYDVILNLFTSFGYFDSEVENNMVMQHISTALKPKGLVVIEYMNPHYVLKNLIESESKIVNNICFEITKEIKNGFVFKHIQFTHHGKNHIFTERVMMITKQQFEVYFAANKLSLKHIYGDYKLNVYEDGISPRMILVAEKI